MNLYSQRDQGAEKSIAKREKMMEFHEIKLIYLSKFKSNGIGQNIRKKTRNLTQNHTQNGSINPDQSFSFPVSKNKNSTFKRGILPNVNKILILNILWTHK